MAEINSVTEESSEQNTSIKKETDTTAASSSPSENVACHVPMETDTIAKEKEIVPSSPGSHSCTGKMYTEEEKLKRKEFFRQQKVKKRLQNKRNRERLTLKKNSQLTLNKTVTISYDMTDEDKKMLEFYKVRLSVLKKENHELHKRLAYLVEENMKYLQRGPPTEVRYTL